MHLTFASPQQHKIPAMRMTLHPQSCLCPSRHVTLNSFWLHASHFYLQ